MFAIKYLTTFTRTLLFVACEHLPDWKRSKSDIVNLQMISNSERACFAKREINVKEDIKAVRFTYCGMLDDMNMNNIIRYCVISTDNVIVMFR